MKPQRTGNSQAADPPSLHLPDDPLDSFDIELGDMIQHDEIPEFDSVTQIQFAGSENYKAVYTEDNAVTYSKWVAKPILV